MKQNDSISSETATQINIDNSRNNALDTKEGSKGWRNHRNGLYRSIAYAKNRDELGKEAYLIYPSDAFKTFPRASGEDKCKYPHHIIEDNETMFLSVEGVKAAYARARQQGIFKGEVKEHLTRHYRELGLYEGSTMAIDEKMDQNFFDIESYITEHSSMNPLLLNESASKRNQKLVPIYVLASSYDPNKIDENSASVDKMKQYVNAGNLIRGVTRKDKYTHAVIAMDDTFEDMYSIDGSNGPGAIIQDNIMTNDLWTITEHIYVSVMFVTPDEYKTIRNEIEELLKNPQEVKYAYFNLLNLLLGRKTHADKRYICSTFVGYILSQGNAKNVGKDFAKVRPEDITLLPRTFYVATLEDRADFIKRKKDIRRITKSIYIDNLESIQDYNNSLPKIVLDENIKEMKTLDKFFDFVAGKLSGEA